MLSDSSITTFAVEGPAEGEPREGNIEIDARRLLLQDSSTITASVKEGLGGDVTVRAPKYVVLRDASAILAETDKGNGGFIEITSGAFVKSPDSEVSADAGEGIAGAVVINAPAGVVEAAIWCIFLPIEPSQPDI